MDIKIIKNEKHEVEIEVSNVTVAEILRTYLNENGVEFVAWKREHPSKPVMMTIKSESNIAKAVSDAVNAIKKDCDKLVSGLKK
jgi:DNA-directed RNA polymerase subunit L